MSSTRLGRQIAEDMDYLLASWPLLVLLNAPGGSRARILPMRPLSEAARERAEAQAREDADVARLPGYVAPGRHPVPIDVPLLDLLAEFVATAAEVADAVTQTAGVERMRPPASCYVDPRPYLQTARAWLQVACDADERTEPWVGERLHGIADRIATHLGEVHDGQVLEALCPWCNGRTPSRPAGGALTLVVMDRARRATSTPSADDAVRPGEDDRRQPLIVCRGTSCTPPDSDVGLWLGPDDGARRPAWPMREWDWLAQRLLPVPESVPA
jgi:hypothetical protein